MFCSEPNLQRSMEFHLWGCNILGYSARPNPSISFMYEGRGTIARVDLNLTSQISVVYKWSLMVSVEFVVFPLRIFYISTYINSPKSNTYLRNDIFKKKQSILNREICCVDAWISKTWERLLHTSPCIACKENSFVLLDTG